MSWFRRSILGRAAGYAWRWLGPLRRRLFLSPILAGLLTVAETSVLLLAARLLLAFVNGEQRIDIGQLGIDSIGFYQGCGLGIALAAVTGGVRYVDSRFTASLAAAAVGNARSSLLEHAFHTPWQHHRSRRLGELQRMLATNGIAAATPVVVIATVLNAGSAVLVYLGIIMATAPQLLVIVVLLVVALIGAFAPLRRMTKRAARGHARAIAELQLDATSFSSLQREIELYAVQDESLQALQRSNRAVSRVFRQQKFLQRFVSPVYQLALMTSIILAVGFARVADLTVAGVGTAALLLLRSLSYVQQLNNNVQMAIEALPLLEEIDEYLVESSSSRRPWGRASLDAVTSVELRDVTFAYEPDQPILRDVTTRLEPGDRIGIVGSSGGGKSTLANMLVRLTDPTGGEILVNGRPAGDYSPASWARSVAFVGQEPLLVRGTIAENVSLYRPASVEAIETALASANLLESVRAFPDGLDTMVGEGFSSLSGGQRQRLGIARALLTGPSLLVLDEPSSALDAESERQIETALANLAPDTIVAIISHRPFLLKSCNRMLYVVDGTVTENSVNGETLTDGPARSR